jgi:membrane protein required for beta-lactamase induction
MTFLTVLLALFVERVLRQHRPQRQHRWFDTYCRQLLRTTFAQWLMTRPWGAVIALLPPLALIAWLQSFFGELGGPFALVFGVVVLLNSLGPGDLGDEVARFIAARDGDQGEAADLIAKELCLDEVPTTEPQRSLAVARGVLILAARRLIGPIFWFVLFGAVGAAAYRVILLLGERLHNGTCPPEMKHHSDQMHRIADWAPARITAAGYAVAGNFDAVAHAWRTFEHVPGGPFDEAEQLLARTGLAALDTLPEDMAEFAEQSVEAGLIPPVVEDTLALVWRNLTMWVTVIAGGSLIAALA